MTLLGESSWSWGRSAEGAERLSLLCLLGWPRAWHEGPGWSLRTSAAPWCQPGWRQDWGETPALLGVTRLGSGVISCRSGESSVSKESPVGTKISSLPCLAPGSGLERERGGGCWSAGGPREAGARGSSRHPPSRQRRGTAPRLPEWPHAGQPTQCLSTRPNPSPVGAYGQSWCHCTGQCEHRLEDVVPFL